MDVVEEFTYKAFFVIISVFVKILTKNYKSGYFLDLGEKKNYLKGKEQIFDSINLDRYGWVNA